MRCSHAVSRANSAGGLWLPRIANVVVRAGSGLFTELGKGPRSADQLCRALGLSARTAPQWLDALVTLGFLERDGDGERAIYLNTREACHFLDRNSAAYIGAPLEGVGARVYAGWETLIQALRAGDDNDAWRGM